MLCPCPLEGLHGSGVDRLQPSQVHGAADVLRHDHAQAGSGNSVELVLVQVTAGDTRGAAQKQAFDWRLVEPLGVAPGVRPDDILVNLVNLVDVPKKN